MIACRHRHDLSTVSWCLLGSRETASTGSQPFHTELMPARRSTPAKTQLCETAVSRSVLPTRHQVTAPSALCVSQQQPHSHARTVPILYERGLIRGVCVPAQCVTDRITTRHQASHRQLKRSAPAAQPRHLFLLQAPLEGGWPQNGGHQARI